MIYCPYKKLKGYATKGQFKSLKETIANAYNHRLDDLVKLKNIATIGIIESNDSLFYPFHSSLFYPFHIFKNENNTKELLENPNNPYLRISHEVPWKSKVKRMWFIKENGNVYQQPVLKKWTQKAEKEIKRMDEMDYILKRYFDNKKLKK